MSENEDLITMENQDLMDFEGEYENEDYKHLFATSLAFTTREEARDWVYGIGHKNKMYFKVTTARPKAVYLGCERGGLYEDPKVDETEVRVNKRTRKSKGSKKLDCKFQVKLLQKYDDKWFVRVGENRGRHNHALEKYGNWHRSYVNLRGAQMEEIEKLTNANMKPQPILKILQGTNPGLNLRQINNARVKLKKSESNGLNSMSLLFKNLREKNYYVWDRKEIGTSRLRDIVFANPDSMKLLRKFPQVIMLDGTYSTNRHELPLIEVIGVVPTGQNYHIAFAFIKNEITDSFVFLLKAIEEMYTFCEGGSDREFNGPEVIVTDRELAAMNAVRDVFPKAKHLLCRRHISVDVRKYVAGVVSKSANGNTSASLNWANMYSKRWNSLVRSPTVEAYEESLASIENDWSKFSTILDYIRNTWLNPYRERFVSAWTDDHMHYGNTTTNRVEGAHSQLKKWLGSARGSLDTCFKKIHELVELQNEQIKTTFEKCLTVHPHMTRYAVFRLLGGKVTHKAIDVLLDEGRKIQPCDCVLPKTHGLPCKCKMRALAKESRPVELGMIAEFWRSLDMEITGEAARPSAKEVAEEAWNNFRETASESSYYMTSCYLHKMTVPESCEYEEPNTAKTKGRPKNCIGTRFTSAFERMEKSAPKLDGSGLSEERGRGQLRGRGRGRVQVRGRGRGRGRETDRSGKGVVSSSLGSTGASFPHRNEVPSCILPFINLYTNVLMDGNCGFRALAVWRYGNEERWDDVRIDLYTELFCKREFWDRLIDVDIVLSALNFSYVSLSRSASLV